MARAFPPPLVRLRLGWAALAALLITGADLQAQDANQAFDPALFQAMEYRMVGPFRGGRVTAVAGYRDRIHTFLMGTVGGGVWRTEDAGETWHNITDGYLERSPVGAIAVSTVGGSDSS